MGASLLALAKSIYYFSNNYLYIICYFNHFTPRNGRRQYLTRIPNSFCIFMLENRQSYLKILLKIIMITSRDFIHKLKMLEPPSVTQGVK